LLDRVDLRIDVAPVSRAELFGELTPSENSAAIARRVQSARSSALARWGVAGWRMNSEVPGLALRDRRWRLPPPVVAAAETHVERGQLSARGFDRVVKMAWTIADLAGHDLPDSSDVAEALFFRLGRGTAWVA
jgi:magnesium chelatase family protein